jgi:hypothetical protein
MRSLLRAGFAVVSFLPWSRTGGSAATPREVEVHFQLTDLEYAGIPHARVRVTCAQQPDWQAPQAGHRFVTDDRGEARFDLRAAIVRVRHKRPTNFLHSLLSTAQPADHLRVAVELEYAGHTWLYVVDLYRFCAKGDVLMERMTVFSRDDAGRFTSPAERVEGGWKIRDLGGLILTGLGHDPWDFAFHPAENDPSAQRWKLNLRFRRSPEPVLR